MNAQDTRDIMNISRWNNLLDKIKNSAKLGFKELDLFYGNYNMYRFEPNEPFNYLDKDLDKLREMGFGVLRLPQYERSFFLFKGKEIKPLYRVTW